MRWIESRIQRRIATRYLDEVATFARRCDARADAARKEGRALSIGLLGNAAAILPQIVRRGFVPDIVTDQTSAHDPLYGYWPDCREDEDLAAQRSKDPERYLERVRADMAQHVQAILELQRRGSIASTTAITCGRRRRSPAWPMRSTIPALFLRLFATHSARGEDRFVGLRYQAIQPISPRQMRLCSSCFPTTRG